MNKPRYTPEERKERKKNSDRLYREKNRAKINETCLKHYYENREKCLERGKRWVAENKEKRREYERQYRELNHDKERERWRIWQSANTERHRETNRRWRKENPEKQQEYVQSNIGSIRKIKMKSQKLHPETHRETEHRRRTRKNGGVCENINSLEIYERDKWVCRLCNRGVDRELRWPHPMSASLDHIIAIAVGGTHTEGNVQLAHLECNMKAGTKAVRRAA